MKSKNQYIYQDRRNTRSLFDPIDPIDIYNIKEPNLNIKKILVILVIWFLIMMALLSILY